MDLPKAFDTLNHDLLTAKLRAYGFETNALRYVKSYITNIKQRVRVNRTLTERERITTLVLNILLNDIFPSIPNSSLSIHAGGNTLYTFGDDLKNKIITIYAAALIH